MKKHTELTIARINKFRNRLKTSYYSSETPMRASYFRTKEPVPFEEAQKARYQPILPGKKWGDTFDCAWFKFSGIVPEEFTGYETVALVDVGGEACVFDTNGNPVQGLTNKRVEWTMKETIIKKRIYLFKEAKGGEQVEIMVDAGANNILGVENVLTYESMEDGVFNEADLAIFDRQKWYLYIEYDMLTNLMHELPENSRHKKLLVFALNQVVNTYGAGHAEAVAECRQILSVELRKKANASAIKAIAIGHAHIDIAWLWPLRETVRKTARTFSTALRLMEEYPDYKFGASQPHLYQMIKDHYPGLFERIKDAVKRGQWECQGAMWVEADCNLSSGESLARQILYGKKFYQEEFNVAVDNLWLPDVFGYSAALPQLCIKSDVDYFMTQKISWNQFNTFPHHTFIWEGLDGTRIFSHFLAPNNYRSDVSSQDLINLERKNFDTDRSEYALFLYGAGDGGGGPSRIYIEKLRRAQDLEDLPKVTMAFASEFFELASKSARDLQVWSGELYLELHRGTLTTHALTKKLNRRVEFLLREAEWLYATWLSESYPQETFERLWKILLLNQFHDIIPGTSITRVHIESLEQYKQTENELRQLIQQAVHKTAGRVAYNGETEGKVIFNSLNWQREELIELSDSVVWQQVADGAGNPLPVQQIISEGKAAILVKASAPPLSYSCIQRSGQGPGNFARVEASFNYLENELIKVEFNEDDGTICRIYDKQADREVLLPNARANELKLYEDRPNLWDAWDVDIFYEETPAENPPLLSKDIVEEGPLRASIRFEYEDTWYAITQTISLNSFSKRIDFKTRVNWQENERMLRVEFPVNIRTSQATFEVQYGHVKRPTHYNTSWDMAQFEVAGHKWADISQPNYGVALLNNCKYGHKVKGNTISLNLLRSPKNPDPLADMHVHNFTYSLLPHMGDHLQGRVIQEAYQLNVPMRTTPVNRQSGDLPASFSLLQSSAENIVTEAVKKSEDGEGMVIRLYEAYGTDCQARLAFGFELEEVWLVNLVERPLRKLQITGHTVDLYFGPFAIHTLKVKQKAP